MSAQQPNYTLKDILASYPFRVGLYAVITFAVFELVFLGIRTYGVAVMGMENGPIEAAQVVLALIAATGLFLAACWTPDGRAGLVTCGAVVAYAAARESDAIFEQLLFDDAYKFVVGLPMAALCVAVIAAERRRVVADTMSLMHHPAATLFAIAGIFLCFVCQILDRPEMWSAVGAGYPVAETKAVIEEYAELFAYLLLAFSGFEAAVLARHRNAAIRQDVDEEPSVSGHVYRTAA